MVLITKRRIIFLVVVAIAALLLQIDAELSDEANAYMARLDAPGDSQAYLYALGIFVEEGDDPIAFGRRQLAVYESALLDDSIELLEYPEADKLPLPEGEVYCRWPVEGCLGFLFSSEADIQSLLDKHALLMQRVNTFHAFDEYRSLATPTLRDWYPPFKYIVAAEKLNMLKAVQLYKTGAEQRAVDLLLQQVTTMRRALALQDNTTGKLLFVDLLSNAIDLISLMLERSSSGVRVPELSALSVEEKDFSMVAAREFGLAFNTMQNLAERPDFFENDGDAPAWYVKIFFKPNMTMNELVRSFHYLEELTQLSASELAKRITDGEPPSLTGSKLRNYVGVELLKVSFINWDDYVVRLFDLDAKIALFNQIHHQGLKNQTLHNPYYGAEVPAERDGRLCFSGPLDDRQFVRCLRMSL